MAEYCQIKSSSIKILKKEWESFIDECLDEMNRQYTEELVSYGEEARNDKFHERYEEESIDEWYSDAVDKLNKWKESLRNKIVDTYRSGNKIIDEIENKKFYDNETAYAFELDFCEGEIEKNLSDYIGVYFWGFTWDIDGVVISFNPSPPEFTEWMPVKYR